MKSNKLFLIGLMLVVVMVLSVTALAQGPSLNALPTGNSWWTVFQVQNLGDTSAAMQFTAYNDTTSFDGNPDGCTIPVGGSLIFNPNQTGNCGSGGNRLGIDASFNTNFSDGSAVISTDQLARAVVQLGNNPNGSGGTIGGTANAFYQGTADTAVGSSLLFPSAKNDYFGQTTSFFIQAVGGTVTVEASYAMDNGSTYTATQSIDVNEKALFDLSSASVPVGQSPAGGSLGSATFTVTAGTGQIAGAVIEYRTGEAPATIALATKGFTPNEFDTTIVAPTIKLDFYGGSTGFQILNTTNQEATVVVSFKVTNIQPGSDADNDAGYNIGDTKVTTITIPANDFYLFSKGKRAGIGNLDDAGILPGTFASAVAVSTRNIVATVNESNGTNRSIYSAFPASQATKNVALPLVKEDFYGGKTGVAVQNVGSTPTDITVKYTDQNGTTRNVGTFTLSGSAAKSFIKLSTDKWGSDYAGGGGTQVPATTNNAVIITSTSENIVALAQESGNVDTRNYEGFNY